MRGRFNRRRFERVMELIELEAHDRILDLGCGRGRKSVAYYNRVNPIVGVDRQPVEMLDRLGENFRYIRRNASDLTNFADKSFDVVLSFGLLEHPRLRIARHWYGPLLMYQIIYGGSLQKD